MKGFRYPPFAKPGLHGELRPKEVAEVLPSIDEFLDELPPIDDFLEVGAPAESARAAAWSPVEEQLPVVEMSTEEGWAAGTWQSYDWGSLASLNRAIPEGAGADETWGAADWPEPYSTASRPRGDRGASPSADEVADALDGIAHRIRTGELIIDNLQGMPPEAAMAAALAVLLRMRG